MLAAGINLGIGTDGAASNNRMDLLAELRLAALLAKGASGNPSALPAAQARGRHARRRAGAGPRAGGSAASSPARTRTIAAFDLSAVETQPLYDPLSQLAYAAGREQVSDVWVAGQSVVRKR